MSSVLSTVICAAILISLLVGAGVAIARQDPRQDACYSLYDKAFRWTVEAERKTGETRDEDMVNAQVASAYSHLYMACREKNR